MTRSRLAWTLLGLALGLRLAYGLAVGPQAPDVDGYRALGAALAAGDGLVSATGEATARRAPLWPLTLAALRTAAGGERLWLVTLFNAAALTVAAWGTGRLAAERYGEPVGLIALALATVYPYALYYAPRHLSEPLFLALFVPCLVLWQRAFDGPRQAEPADAEAEAAPGLTGRRAAGAAGALLGLATLTRPFTLLLPGALLAWAWAGAAGDRRERLRRWALGTAVFAAVLAPWALRNVARFGRPILGTTTVGVALWGSHNPEVVRDPAWAGNWLPDRLLYARRPDLRRPLPADELAADAALRARAWAFVKEHPGLLPWLAWRKEVHTWELYLRDPLQDAPGKDLVKALGYKLPFAIFLLAAAVELRRRRRLGIYALPAYVVLLVAATHGQSRYRLPADPVWMAVAAWGVATAWAAARRARQPDPAPA